MSYTLSLYRIGRELAGVEREMSRYHLALSQLHQETGLHLLEMYQQTVLNLLSQTEDGSPPWLLVGESYSEKEMLPLHREANNRNAICHLFHNKLILSYLFQAYPQAMENAAITEEHLDAVTALIEVPLFHFYDSLSRLAVFSDAQPSERKRLLKKVAANQKKLQERARHSPQSYLHKHRLVEAERARVLGHDKDAREYYDQAIALAQENEYLSEQALAFELAARFCLDRGQAHLARYYLREAYYAYQQWGAMAKIKDMEDRYPELLIQPGTSSIATASTMARPQTITPSTGTQPATVLDLTSVLKASQALSGEIVLETLLARMMKIVVENAGAEKGFLILNRQGQWMIEAEGTAESDDVRVLQSVPIETVDGSSETPMVSNAIVNYVIRTKESVVLSDAVSEGDFTRDPYVVRQQPKSVLCTPLLNQGRLVGILYLENNLTTGAFTVDRLEVLNLLSSQVAISIDNASLYNTLEQRVKERTRELEQEITERKRAESIIKQMAYHDALTGLPNRRLFNDRLNLALAHAKRNQQKLAVMLFDLDHFKEVNDTLGHSVGDQLLQVVSEQLMNLLRKGDTVARMGGDEFMLLLPEIAQVEGAAEVAQKILEAIRKPYVFDGHELHVTTSIGIAFYPNDGEDADTLMKNADIAMYRAKGQGRDDYQCHTPAMNARALE